jgi:kumamolisin
MTPEDVARAYNIEPLHRKGIQGQGQTVAIVSFATFLGGDVDEFDSVNGIKGPKVEHVTVGAEDNHDLSPEVTLDIDVVRAIAPKAKILDFEAVNDTSKVTWADMFQAVAADRRKPTIASVSWGSCDTLENESAADRKADEEAMSQAMMAGINIFVASGDDGAYQCLDETDAPTVSYPADSPSIVSVGGTLLSVRKDGSYFRESSWEDIVSGWSTGGGLNPVEARPSWQTGAGVLNRFSNGKRQIPDVAGPADIDSPIRTIYKSRPSLGNGTSQATPFWAASVALARQLAQRRHAGKFPFLNPVLYRLAARKSSPFNDVVRGGNRLYRATHGWDYATGLGSPDVTALAREVAGDLKRSR